MKRFYITTVSALAAAALITGAADANAKDSTALDLARQLNDAFVEVADEVSPAVVVIDVTQKQIVQTPEGGSFWDLFPPEIRQGHEGQSAPRVIKPQGEGSGIIITADGYILTNNHVVENAEKISVRLKDGTVFDAEVKGTDPESDIAVIKIKATGLTAAKLGNSDKSRVGEFVLALGAPFTLSDTVTVGHISAKGRSFEMENKQYADQDFIQTDARINPGNSGGPLVNLYGEVIGINSMIRGLDTGIGFAIPINLARRVEERLITDGKFTRSWLGVEITELKNYQDYKNLGQKLAPDVSAGVVVAKIEAGGPASKSDLQASDVIVAVDGKPVQTARELKDEISAKKAGVPVTLDVVRGQDHVSIKVTPEELPSNGSVAQTTASPGGETQAPVFGLTVEPLTHDRATQLGVEPGSGVLVTGVEPNSVAEEYGLKPGDIITEINRKPVVNLPQFRESIHAANAKNGMMVNLIRDGTSQFVILKEGGS